MFLLIFFLVMSISQYINNWMMQIDDSSEDAYYYGQRDSRYIALTFLLSIVLEVITRVNIPAIKPFIQNYLGYITLGYGLTVLLLMILLSGLRKQDILKKREELLNVFQIVRPLITSAKDAEIDYNNPGFELEYKYGNVNKINVPVEPTKFSSGVDKVLTPIVAQLNAFLPTYSWNYESHLEERYLTLVGSDKPPELARWPGSWLRHFRFMPVGISGKGEVAYQPDSVPKKEYGRSLYLNEKGDPIPTDTSLPTQPQALVCGATGGGKSVMIQNVIIHCLEHRDKIAIGMVDPKQVEFSNYKGMNGVVGVANNTREAVELLRIARLVMLKRNKEMANLGIKSLTEYKPSKRSGKEYITGRDFNEHDMLKVRINGEEQQMSASDFVDYLHTDFSLEAEVCLNGTDWITVNGNCCDHRYEDEFPILLIVVDELAELTQKGGLKTTEGKEEDAMKDEIIGIIQSITQLGRSAGVLMMLATQKPNASIVPTVIRSNPLSLDTYVEVVDD